MFRNLGNTNYWLEIDLEGVRSNRDGIGAVLIATTGGQQQVRTQGGGMHLFSQNHQRIHFGLGRNKVVDELRIEWPSGIVQVLTDIPANQLVHVYEPVSPSIAGRPPYQSMDPGVFVWEDPESGLIRLRTSAPETAPADYEIRVLSAEPLIYVGASALESDDVFTRWTNGFKLTSRVGGDEDAVDFAIPEGTEVFLAVEKDGKSNPRQIFFGSLGLPLPPSGWIVPGASIPARPTFNPSTDLGLYLGWDSSGNILEARWGGGGIDHSSAFQFVWPGRVPESVTPVNFESDDAVWTASYGSIKARVNVRNWYDGLDLMVPRDHFVGIFNEQDGLFQPHRLNGNSRVLGAPNAYKITGSIKSWPVLLNVLPSRGGWRAAIPDYY